MGKKAASAADAVRRNRHQFAGLAEGYAPSIDPATYTGSGWLNVPSAYPPIDPADVTAIRQLMADYNAAVGDDHWQRFTGDTVQPGDTGQAYQEWYALHYGFVKFIAQENPSLYAKLTAYSGQNPYLFQTAVGPNYEIINGDPGTVADAIAYVDAQMSHFEDVAKRRLLVVLAAAVGAAAVAGAFSGAGASQVVADTATGNAAAAGGELTDITLPASATYLPTSIATTALDPAASLLTMPAFDAAAVAPLADKLVSAVNTPEMQAAIAAGDVPPVPTGIGSSAFNQWATSTGIKYLEQQLGRALTPQEQQSVEQQMAAEIQRLQNQLAQNPGAAPYMGATDWSALFPYLAIGGLVLAGAYALA